MIIAKYDNDYQDISSQQEDEIEYLLSNSSFDHEQREHFMNSLSMMTSEEAYLVIEKLRQNQLNIFTHTDGSKTDRFLNAMEVLESKK